MSDNFCFFRGFYREGCYIIVPLKSGDLPPLIIEVSYSSGRNERHFVKPESRGSCDLDRLLFLDVADCSDYFYSWNPGSGDETVTSLSLVGFSSNQGGRCAWSDKNYSLDKLRVEGIDDADLVMRRQSGHADAGTLSLVSGNTFNNISLPIHLRVNALVVNLYKCSEGYGYFSVFDEILVDEIIEELSVTENDRRFNKGNSNVAILSLCTACWHYGMYINDERLFLKYLDRAVGFDHSGERGMEFGFNLSLSVYVSALYRALSGSDDVDELLTYCYDIFYISVEGKRREKGPGVFFDYAFIHRRAHTSLKALAGTVDINDRKVVRKELSSALRVKGGPGDVLINNFINMANES